MRKANYVYRLTVDPDQLSLSKEIITVWILRIIIQHGGRILRCDLLEELEEVLKEKRPKLRMSASSVLSCYQAKLQEQGVLQIETPAGLPVEPQPRGTLLKEK